MLRRLTTQFREHGWNFAFRPHDIGKELGRTVFFGFSVGCMVKAVINVMEGSADVREVKRRQERLAMVDIFVYSSLFTNSRKRNW